MNGPRTSHDYDLLLVKIATDGSADVVERADTKQSFSPPLEWLVYTIREPGTYGLAVWRARDAKVTLFKLISPSHDLDGPISIAGSLTSPGDARGALTVGALGHRNYTTGPIESYSSQGPTFDGRIKPDLVARCGGSHAKLRPFGLLRHIRGNAPCRWGRGPPKIFQPRALQCAEVEGRADAICGRYGHSWPR